jgi:hypothetical protein
MEWFIRGEIMEFEKFAERRAPYRKALAEIRKLRFSIDDFIHHNPAFVGHMNIARLLALYETYKLTLGLAGHIAEVGVWKGATLLYFAKLAQIFEPESLTLIHGFDWFRGMARGADEMTARVTELWNESPSTEDEVRPRTSQEADEMYQRVTRLISAQDLDKVVRLHKMDVTEELDQFFDEHSHLQFKIVFLDAGTYEVVHACLPHFWPRLNAGGVLILDQFNHEIAPGETRALREYLPDLPVRSYHFTSRPSGYIVKPGPSDRTPAEGLKPR